MMMIEQDTRKISGYIKSGLNIRLYIKVTDHTALLNMYLAMIQS